MSTYWYEYKRGYLKDLLSKEDDAFFKMYKFTCSLPRLQSILLSYLIDAEDLVKNRLDEDRDYFECCVEGFIHNLLSGLSISEIRTALKGLEMGGYIAMKNVRKGFKNTTFIRIDKNAVLALRQAYLDMPHSDEDGIYYAENSYSDVKEADETNKKIFISPPNNAAPMRYY